MRMLPIMTPLSLFLSWGDFELAFSVSPEEIERSSREEEREEKEWNGPNEVAAEINTRAGHQR